MEKKFLSELLKPLNVLDVKGAVDGVEIYDLVCDSRCMTRGALFVAVRGVAVDSHKFIPDVVAAGAAAVPVHPS